MSGVTGYDYTTMHMPSGFADQPSNCFATIDDVLQQAGFSRADVVRVQYTVVSSDLVADLVPVFSNFLAAVRPAATVVIEGLIQPEMLVEIETTAFKG